MLTLPALPPSRRGVDELSSPVLAIDSTCDSAQIEVGGPFVGIEMHHSSPLLNRISLFYPVANSIDLSTDYWQRNDSRVMFLGLKVGRGPKEWVGLKPFAFRLTPYSVMFDTVDGSRAIQISYQFCKEKPAMVARLEITSGLAEPALGSALRRRLAGTTGRTAAPDDRSPGRLPGLEELAAGAPRRAGRLEAGAPRRAGLGDPDPETAQGIF